MPAHWLRITSSTEHSQLVPLMPRAFNEDQLVEQPAIGFIKEEPKDL
jgi:hypothetical protein